MQATNVNPATLGEWELPLNTGRVIRPDQIVQWRTYGGMLYGHPTLHINERQIEGARAKAVKHFGDAYPVTLLPPEITEYDYPPPGRQKFFLCEALPPIYSAAVFSSDPTVRYEGCNSSALIVWLQHEWGLPSPAIQAQIAALDWDGCAKDWMW